MPLEANSKKMQEEHESWLKNHIAFMAGNKAAAARARKALSNMTKLAKEMRKEIADKKASM